MTFLIQYNILSCLIYLIFNTSLLNISLILGYLTSFIEMGNLAGLRTFRVLRALKTVAILPSKWLVEDIVLSASQIVPLLESYQKKRSFIYILLCVHRVNASFLPHLFFIVLLDVCATSFILHKKYFFYFSLIHLLVVLWICVNALNVEWDQQMWFSWCRENTCSNAFKIVFPSYCCSSLFIYHSVRSSVWVINKATFIHFWPHSTLLRIVCKGSDIVDDLSNLGKHFVKLARQLIS